MFFDLATGLGNGEAISSVLASRHQWITAPSASDQRGAQHVSGDHALGPIHIGRHLHIGNRAQQTSKFTRLSSRHRRGDILTESRRRYDRDSQR